MDTTLNITFIFSVVSCSTVLPWLSISWLTVPQLTSWWLVTRIIITCTNIRLSACWCFELRYKLKYIMHPLAPEFAKTIKFIDRRNQFVTKHWPTVIAAYLFWHTSSFWTSIPWSFYQWKVNRLACMPFSLTRPLCQKSPSCIGRIIERALVFKITFVTKFVF